MLKDGKIVCAREAVGDSAFSGASGDIIGPDDCDNPDVDTNDDYPDILGALPEPSCGQSCWGPVNLCGDAGGCRCIADLYQGVGSKYYTGVL